MKRLLTWVMVLGMVGLLTGPGVAAMMPVDITPYDNQMRRVEGIVKQSGRGVASIDKATLANWMGEIRKYRYVRRNEWRTPTETEKTRSGDCKDKAVLLLSRLVANGDYSARLVIGYRSERSTETHAWLEWSVGSIRYILDPTNDSRPREMSSVEGYTKKYVYAGGRKYAYVSDSVMLAGL